MVRNNFPNERFVKVGRGASSTLQDFEPRTPTTELPPKVENGNTLGMNAGF